MKGLFLIIFCLFFINSEADAQYGNPNYSLQNRKKVPPPTCVEEKHILQSEMILLNFDSGRSTVGEDQLDPVKTKIQAFLTSSDLELITDIEVVASSSKAPFYTSINGKKVLDPDSNNKNLNLAKERASFAEKVMGPLKASHPKINFAFCAQLGGPDFKPLDLNDRFVTRMTPSYGEKLESLYQTHKSAFNDQALIHSSYDLIDEQKFGNLFQAKFKPFHGIRYIVRGYKRESLKCLDPKIKKAVSPTATKQ